MPESKDWSDKQMKRYRSYYVTGLAALCAAMLSFSPVTAWAAVDYAQISSRGITAGQYVAVVKEQADIYVSMDSYDILKTAAAGEYFPVLHDEGGGWMEVQTDGGSGYLSAEDVDMKEQAAFEKEQETAAQEQAEASRSLRQSVVDFAKQFLGCRYQYGGNDPHTGVDCSGFVRYVMQNAAGVALQRSSRSQASQGRAVSADQMRPGDLIFYAAGAGINHVAIYAGDGQVVHASTYKTGVKLSPWTYRTPALIVNVLGD